MKDHLFYLVDANVAVPLRSHFKIQKKFVETTNFVPEMLPANEPVLMNSNAVISKGDTWMLDLDLLMENDSTSRMKSPFSPSDSFLRLMDEDDDKDKKEEDWDEDEEEWDDEEDEDDDEEWDEDDEDWDEDEDWDDEDLDDEDEEWDEDEEEE
ncbi:hypothetical protein L0222_18510 [bacterium]|nr:hypothetical protein [bacterium]MCI0604316.1 hypothetical protein [bacterium]